MDYLILYKSSGLVRLQYKPPRIPLARKREWLRALRREAVAAPEDVGGEDGEGHHEGDPDAVRARQDGQVEAGIDETEAGVQQIDEETPPLDQQEPHTDEDVQGG